MAKKIFALLASSLFAFACSDNGSDASSTSSMTFQNNDVVAKTEASFVRHGCENTLGKSEELGLLQKSAGGLQIIADANVGAMPKDELWVNEDGSATANLKFGVNCGYDKIEIWKNQDTLFVSASRSDFYVKLDSVTGDTLEAVIVKVPCFCETDVTVTIPAEYLGAKYLMAGSTLREIEYKKR